MGKSVDNKARDEAVPEMDIDVCDDCGGEHAKDDLSVCRRCGAVLCDFCLDLHECGDDDGETKPEKKR